MHYHLEMILPPEAKDNLESIIEQVMKPFSEENEENRDAFWDWYVIGGRWDAAKLTSQFDKDVLERFYEELQKRGVTVSSVQMGVPTLQPDSQEPEVDELFRSFFPEWNGPCPLFSHGLNSQYHDNVGYPNVMTVSELSKDFSASHMMVVPRASDGNFRASNMYLTSIWNGVTFQDTDWDGKLLSAIDKHHARLVNYTEDYRERNTVTGNWIAVTIDYHS